MRKYGLIFLLIILLNVVGCKSLKDTNGAVAIHNMSANSIWYVYISPSSSPTWGSNLLPGIIFTGETQTFGGLAPDTYDVKTVDLWGTSTMTYGIVVNQGATTDVYRYGAQFPGGANVPQGPEPVPDVEKLNASSIKSTMVTLTEGGELKVK